MLEHALQQMDSYIHSEEEGQKSNTESEQKQRKKNRSSSKCAIQ